MGRSDLDHFGKEVKVAAATSNDGRPRVPLHTSISLPQTHTFNESDDSIVKRWAETPRWPFASGFTDHDDRPYCDAATLIKVCQLLLGDKG